MAQVLFITTSKVKQLTPLGGNIDSTKMEQCITAFQDTEIEQLLGTKLYDKLKSDVSGNSLTGYYLELMTELQPVMAWGVAQDYIQFGWVTLGNGGIFTYNNEKGQSVTGNDVSRLSQECRNKKESYMKKVVRWLCANSMNVPEYYENVNGDQYPSSGESNFSGWEL